MYRFDLRNTLEDNTLDNKSDAFDVDFALKLIEFNFWENQRVWDLAIAPLTDDQFTQEFSFLQGSVQGECQQIMNTESVYLQRIRGASGVAGASIDDTTNRKAIAAGWTSVRLAWTDFADELDENQFFTSCEFESDGIPCSMVVWQMIFHVLYHGTSRRSNILRLVAEVDQPVEFDLSLLQHLTGLLRQ